MKREIKFRCWNDVAKTMIGWDQMGDDHWDLWLEFKEARHMMQFTGLKDKNGKEIYEGDIVQRGVILFSDGKFQGFYYESNGGIAERWEDDLCQERNIEVLGNMYENPELLLTE